MKDVFGKGLLIQNIQRTLKTQEENTGLKHGPKGLNRHLTKIDIQMGNKHAKDAPYHILLKKWKVKQCYVTIHLLEWPGSGILTIPNTGEDVEE